MKGVNNYNPVIIFQMSKQGYAVSGHSDGLAVF